ncbi:solute carrier family 4 member 1a (Diego blood group) [Myxocyprinus asiaticus]|uniref:solute carrier family 4 member 1a (Diego blood group) n=1 Tax=Myxocyprinus asiaticus TaxID=70543 RepID=UPI002221659F|nr:solute carrier family 4 member 1a (Diego blood group) [Myxocyprinus asiaticus]XP_051570671.1 solute carrier family 4 member 1a (Diego blood group) [Myxocyprinus asiaticus]XP_051570672.1 solute carrier family 4 member 1a (Diego blood group) [Myxocyprinus asiaticus]
MMETVVSFKEDNDMSYEDSESSLPSPFSLTPAGHKGSYDLEQMRQQEEEQNQSFTFTRDLEAARNTNTNAIKRGDAEAYVELNELRGEVWQEMGRWVGYEENFSPATGQWGASHISYLTFKSLIQLRKVMSTGAVLLDVDDSSLSSIAQKMVEQLLLKKEIRPTDRDALVAILQRKRSQLELTSSPSSGDIEMQTFSVTKQRDMVDRVEASVVLSGVVENLQKPVVAFARLQNSVVMEGVLEAPIPVRFVFFLVGPSHSGLDYHESGRAMAALMADWVFTLEAYLATNEKDLTNAMADFMDCSIVIPPTEIQEEAMLKPIVNFQKKMLRERVRPYDTRLMVGGKAPTGPDKPREDPLARTGYPFGGMIKDIKRRYKHYLSDFKDALDPQVLSAIIFIYFAALSPAITFGGLLADKTEHMIGVSEMMVATCVQGVIFCLFAAQPVLIIGFTGPLMVFEEAFFQFCKSHNFEYIVGRVWVGMWLIVIVVVIMAVEGSFLVRFISRFTQEIFSILISLIFIYETFAKLIKIFKAHPLILNYDHLNHTLEDPFHPVKKLVNVTRLPDGNVTELHEEIERAYPNTALLSMCLMFGCFFIAYYLRGFKTGVFLPGPIRRMIGDFGVPIAIFFMIAVDISIKDAYTQKLVVPKGLTVSNTSARGWIINPLGEKKEFPIWMMFACVVPAILVFILIFLESQITTLIVSKPERKMVKGSGFHLDLLLLVFLGGVGSIFGVPWLSAATVRSVTHANALTVMTKGPRPQIERVIEQRVSGILVAVMIGVSILMEPILKMIPMTALFGIFLYMGITSLNGIQLWDRMLLLIMPKKHHPSVPFVTRVPTMRMHLYTLIQVMCLVILWAVKSSTFSLALPFVLILTIPLRMFMTGHVFTVMEMKCLDADDANVKFDDEDD